MVKGAESLILSSQTGVTDANGNASFVFPSGMFDNPPVISVSMSALGSFLLDARISSVSLTGCTVNVRRSAVLTVLGVNVLGALVGIAGVTVHMVAIEPEDYI